MIFIYLNNKRPFISVGKTMPSAVLSRYLSYMNVRFQSLPRLVLILINLILTQACMASS